MIKKILLGFILILALSVQSQTKKKAQPSYENTVKNYVKWFESLPDYKKREESIILVNKLNRMSPHDKGLWLATMSKYSKVEEVNKNVIDSLSNEGVKKKLLAELKNTTYVNGEQKIDTIIILRSTTGKERTFAENTKVREEIARLKEIIIKADKKMDSIGGSVDYHYRNGNKEYMDAYHDCESAKFNLPHLRDKIITYRGAGDNNWNSYLKDLYELEIHLSVPHILTDDELDNGITSTNKYDKLKKIYVAEFVRGINYYKDKIRDDKKSTFNINEVAERDQIDDYND